MIIEINNNCNHEILIIKYNFFISQHPNNFHDELHTGLHNTGPCCNIRYTQAEFCTNLHKYMHVYECRQNTSAQTSCSPLKINCIETGEFGVQYPLSNFLNDIGVYIHVVC